MNKLCLFLLTSAACINAGATMNPTYDAVVKRSVIQPAYAYSGMEPELTPHEKDKPRGDRLAVGGTPTQPRATYALIVKKIEPVRQQRTQRTQHVASHQHDDLARWEQINTILKQVTDIADRNLVTAVVEKIESLQERRSPNCNLWPIGCQKGLIRVMVYHLRRFESLFPGVIIDGKTKTFDRDYATVIALAAFKGKEGNPSLDEMLEAVKKGIVQARKRWVKNKVH